MYVLQIMAIQFSMEVIVKLLIIHGPPAAGKLTVACEIEKRTQFKVFHNHLSIDCVKPVFEFGSPPFNRLVEYVRMATITEAARENVDLIHTFVYAFGEDDEHFARIIASAEDHGGVVHLVLLTCESEELKRRIANESRVEIGKLTNPDSVEASLKRYDLLSALPGRETLTVDTTDTPPEVAAMQIIEHFCLTQQGQI